MSRTTFKQWWQALPIPWLVSGVNGQAEGNGWPALLDAQTVLLDSARKQAYPDYCASDALPHLGGDRGLIQGPSESDSNFRIRIKYAWETWSRAGRWVTLLEQLYWADFTGAVIVQQNGLAYTLSGAPTAGADPTSLLTVTTCSALGAIMTSSVNPPTITNVGRSIPEGTPWWPMGDRRSINSTLSDTDYCNRFAVLFPSVPLPALFSIAGRATFANTDSAALTWSSPVSDSTDYPIVCGPAVVTDGGSAIAVAADGTTRTASGVTILADSLFTGYVDCWAVGGMSAANLARLRSIIRTWRPNALCHGIYIAAQGKFMDWPVQLQSANTMNDGAVIIRYEGA